MLFRALIRSLCASCVLGLWPLPRVFEPGSGDLRLSSSFSISAAAQDADGVLAFNVDHYLALISARPGCAAGDFEELPELQHLLIDVEDLSVDLQLGVNESYELALLPEGGTLKAASVWGAVRGLETFVQLLAMNGPAVLVAGNGLHISDSPRFPWRGLMMDCARHFFPVSNLKRVIDAMAMNKLNALHLHLADGEAFPVVIEAFPKLAGNGSYHPTHATYSSDDLRAVVAYGRLRGVRIVPEFDLPAHMDSWAVGYPELQTYCPDWDGGYPQWPGYYIPADVTNPKLLEVLRAIVVQLASVFPDNFWHIGGDEPHFDCWSLNENVSAFKREHNLTDTGLYAMFNAQYQSLLQEHGKTALGWAETMTLEGTRPLADTVGQAWTGDNAALDAIVRGHGRRGLVSAGWYLNDGGTWESYWQREPLAALSAPTEAEVARVLGGEACLWTGEDGCCDWNDAETTTWPRAAGTAERLWSAASVTNVTTARGRLAEHRCRMVRRGIRASPVAEDLCTDEVYVPKSRSYRSWPFVPPALHVV